MHSLVTGATGYVGGRLVPRLLAAGHRVRVLARDPDRLAGRPWAARVEVVRGDLLDASTLPAALAGIDAAYYLVHSMDERPGSAERDLRAAGNFAAAAREAGTGRIVYLGGLGDATGGRSPHLASRQATGRRLAEAGVPVVELRAGAIVGSGSLSFEIVRALTERLPVMLCPRWLYSRVQPVAVRDVLAYLAAALELPGPGQVVEIGGADVLTTLDMMRTYAGLRRLRRWHLPVPTWALGLSAHGMHWTTPVPKGIARPFLDGLRCEPVVRDGRARALFPGIVPMGFAAACALALERTSSGGTETRWTDSLWTSLRDTRPVHFESEAGLLVDRRRLAVRAPPEAVFRAFTGIGGERGWFYANWSWQLRGIVDRMLGGVGLRRGRRHPDELRPGDALDFWRVEAVEPAALLRLRAEMKNPGRAWLQFEARPAEGGTLLAQTAFFEPRGLGGLAYWYALVPIHALIFANMIRRVAERAETLAAGG